MTFQQSTRTHCRNGHAYTETNTRLEGKGKQYRRCLVCKKAVWRRNEWLGGKPRRRNHDLPKVCVRCRRLKIADCFYRQGKSGKLSSYCKPCCSAYRTEWDRRNRTPERRAKKAAEAKARYWANPEAKRARNREYHRRTKGKYSLLVA